MFCFVVLGFIVVGVGLCLIVGGLYCGFGWVVCVGFAGFDGWFW